MMEKNAKVKKALTPAKAASSTPSFITIFSPAPTKKAKTRIKLGTRTLRFNGKSPKHGFTPQLYLAPQAWDVKPDKGSKGYRL
jgi:hypothetical protein